MEKINNFDITQVVLAFMIIAIALTSSLVIFMLEHWAKNRRNTGKEYFKGFTPRRKQHCFE